jgi:uncharacterized protein (DUF427 family)
VADFPAPAEGIVLTHFLVSGDAGRSRGIRATLAGPTVLDTMSARYVWEWSHYPQYYIPLADIDPAVLVHDQHEQKLSRGTTSGYWTGHLGDTSYPDIAWTYDFPTRQLLPIAGLIAFYNEKVDTFLDGRLLDRPGQSSAL